MELKKSGESKELGVKMMGHGVALNDKVREKEEIRITTKFLAYLSTWTVVLFTGVGGTRRGAGTTLRVVLEENMNILGLRLSKASQRICEVVIWLNGAGI